MMTTLEQDLDELNLAALAMSAKVEQSVRDASIAFLEQDTIRAQCVINADRAIDALESHLSAKCLRTLAMHHLEAGDLRFVFSLAKIASILERIGDLSDNLAHKAMEMAGREPVAVPGELFDMVDCTCAMLRDSVDSLVDRDPAKAKIVLLADRRIGEWKRQVSDVGEKAIASNPEHCRQWIVVVSAARNIERSADMVSTIAAEVVYSNEGFPVRRARRPARRLPDLSIAL